MRVGSDSTDGGIDSIIAIRLNKLRRSADQHHLVSRRVKTRPRHPLPCHPTPGERHRINEVEIVLRPCMMGKNEPKTMAGTL